MLRACFSGDAACTGIAPCDACAKAVNTRVLPKAMVAAGFNGSIETAQRFFDAYIAAQNELIQQAPHEMAQAMAAPEATTAEPAPVKEPESQQETVQEEVVEVTEEEITSMGQIEDVVDEPNRPGARLSPKHARAMARMARAIKKKRAQRNSTKEEDTHG